MGYFPHELTATILKHFLGVVVVVDVDETFTSAILSLFSLVNALTVRGDDLVSYWFGIPLLFPSAQAACGV